MSCEVEDLLKKLLAASSDKGCGSCHRSPAPAAPSDKVSVTDFMDQSIARINERANAAASQAIEDATKHAGYVSMLTLRTLFGSAEPPKPV